MGQACVNAPDDDPTGADAGARDCAAVAMNDYLVTRGTSVPAVLADQARKNWDPRQNGFHNVTEPSINRWPVHPFAAEHQTYPVTPTARNLPRWASHYAHFTPPGSGAADTLTVTVNAPDAGALSASLVVRETTTRREVLGTFTNGVATLTVPDFGGAAVEVALVVTNATFLRIDGGTGSLAFTYSAAMGVVDAGTDAGAADAGSFDAGAGTTDAGTGTTDAGSGTTDAGSGTTDAGSGTTDAGSGTTDAGAGTTDAGSLDAGAGTTDAGTTDAGSGTDAGATDAGGPQHDAGTDGGSGSPDASVPDAGSAQPDAGVSAMDAGAPDAGTPPTDGGTTPVDAGSADAGSAPLTPPMGCGCQLGSDGLAAFLGVLALRRRRRASRAQRRHD